MYADISSPTQHCEHGQNSDMNLLVQERPHERAWERNGPPWQESGLQGNAPLAKILDQLSGLCLQAKHEHNYFIGMTEPGLTFLIGDF